MKKQVIGERRFSKIEQSEISAKSDFDKYLKTHGRAQADGTIKIGYDLSERMDLLERNAKAVLKNANLPDQVRISHDKGWTDIINFVRDKGYEHDSAEGLAAEILVNTGKAKHSKKEEQRMTAMFRLGELRTYAKVYGIESLTQRNNARKPRKDKALSALAVDLAASYQKFPDAWKSIPEDDSNDDDIYRYGDKLICHDSEGAHEIDRESFRTGYFSLAKNGKL